jgi:glycerol-1-phosphate dehydrogenase [NAD(P)+]
MTSRPAPVTGAAEAGAPGGAEPLVVIEADLAGLEAELIARAGIRAPFAVVCDGNTVEVLGRQVAEASGGRTVVLESPHADLATAQDLAGRCRDMAGLVAVGSGTLNDLVKWAADRLRIPCAVFATAPSMNGWLTATASLAVSGVKRSLPVVPPRGAFFALDVLAAAPLRLIRAGLGDALCRPVVEADLRLARCLVDAPLDEAWFAPLRAAEREVRARAGHVLARDPGAIRLLVELLVAQGLVMRRAGTSAPASQGEHAIAHLVECFARPPVDAFHGELVAVATVTMAGLQARLMHRSEPPALAPVAVDPDRLASVYGATTGEALDAVRALGLDDPERVAELARRLEAGWPELRRELAPIVAEARSLPPLYETLGLPVRPDDLGIDPRFYGEAAAVAFALRPRFGFLALAVLAGRVPGSAPACDESR